MSTPDSFLDEGKRLMEENNLASAREAFERAVALVEGEHGLQAEELIAPLSWLAKAYRADRYTPCPEVERSISVLARAILIAEASPCDEPRLAALLTFQGVSLWFNGQHERAMAAVARSLELTKRWTIDTREQTSLLAEILHSAGRSADALVYARAFVQQEEGFLGEKASKSYALLLLADCLRQADRKTEARAVMLEILAWEDAGNEEVKRVVQRWLDELDVTTPSTLLRPPESTLREPRVNAEAPGRGSDDGEAPDFDNGAKRKVRIHCPKCRWTPSAQDRWHCSCLHTWNTFDTRGICPACSRQWKDTQCLRCGEWSPHEEWYET